MNTLDQLIERLQKLQAEGHGNKLVFGVISSSGAAYGTASARVTDRIDAECGPFDLDGAEYVSLTLG